MSRAPSPSPASRPSRRRGSNLRPITEAERANPTSLFYVEPERTWPRQQQPEPPPKKPTVTQPFRRARYLPETFYGDRAL